MIFVKDNVFSIARDQYQIMINIAVVGQPHMPSVRLHYLSVMNYVMELVLMSLLMVNIAVMGLQNITFVRQQDHLVLILVVEIVLLYPHYRNIAVQGVMLHVRLK